MFEFPKPTESYTNLKSYSEPWGLSYGPLPSRRFGSSLGINPFNQNTKVCSYDCPYCELGPTHVKMNQVRKQMTHATVDEIIESAKSQIGKAQKNGERIDTICISGLGEPTLYPQLPELIERLLQLRQHLEMRTPVVILTNGAHLDSRKLVVALNQLNETHVKLDAGNERILKAINAPIVRITISKLIGLFRPVENLVVQSMFVSGSVDNSKPADLDEWFEAVGMLKPQKVHICTLDRVPAISGLTKVSEDSLYTIGSLLKRKTGIEFEVFA